jgi:hypothetical protein
MKKPFLITLFFMILSLPLFSADELPELRAKHGGIVKKIDNAFLEVVQEKEYTRIYITGHDHKNIADKNLSLLATAQVNGKSYPMRLNFENDHYSASPANSYLHKEKNFVLMLTISFSGTVDRANFSL